MRPFTHPRRPKAGVLIEVVVSLVIFVAAAAFTLRTVRQTTAALERAQLEQQAVDLARSRMAELESGLITLADLQVGDVRGMGSWTPSEIEPATSDWLIDVETQRTGFGDLVLVTLSVERAAALDEDREPVSFALRQLVNLRPQRPRPYEPDDLLRDLPADAEVQAGEAP